MKIYDTRAKKKLEFIPLKDKAARIYVCGPTVYDDAHLGHAKALSPLICYAAHLRL